MKKSNVECLVCGKEMRALKCHLKEVHHLTPQEYRTIYPNAVISKTGIRSLDKIEEHEKENYIQCMICGRWLKQITTGHLGLHNTSAAEYRNKYPDALLTSRASKDKMSQTQKRLVKKHPDRLQKLFVHNSSLWQDPERRERLMKGIEKRPSQSDLTKDKISATMKKRYEDGLTPLNIINKNQRGIHNNFYGKNHMESGVLSSNGVYEDLFKESLSRIGFLHEFLVAQGGRVLAKIDFADESKMLALEIDTKYHNRDRMKKADEVRDEALKELGWSVRRVRVTKKLSIMVNRINDILEEFGYADKISEESLK